MKISLCLFVWNEVEGCKIDVPQIDRQQFFEVFAVDGGSTDGTVEYLESQDIPVSRQPRPTLNAAYHHAFDVAGGDAIVFFHPKGVVPVKDTIKFRQYLENGCDLVIASRNMKGARNEEDGQVFRPRKWFVDGLGLLASVLWRRQGRHVRDVLHGFRAIKRDAFARMKMNPIGVTADLEQVVQCYKRRMSAAEFPTQEVSRPFGATHFKAWPTGSAMLKYIVKETGLR